jgi:hypothetical protein
MTGLVSFLDIQPSQAKPITNSRPSDVRSAAPSEYVTPTEDDATTQGLQPIREILNSHKELAAVTAGESPSVVLAPPEGLSSSEVVTPTEGIGYKSLLTTAESGGDPGNQHTPPTTNAKAVDGLVAPSVGVFNRDARDEKTLWHMNNARPDGSGTVGDSPSDQDTQSRERENDSYVGVQSPALPLVVAGTWVSIVTGVHYESKRVQRVTLAQQSMGLGEERVYQTLWHAKPSEGVTQLNRRMKSFSLGYDRLARLTRLNEKSIRDLMPKLIEKKILEIVMKEDSWTRTGRTYYIYSYEEILERQRAADLCYVVKNGRAVEFVRPAAQVTVGVPPTANVGGSPTVHVSPAVSATRTATVGSPGLISVGDATTPLDSTRQSTSQNTSSSNDIELLAQLVQSTLPTFDDDAVRQLWYRCQQIAPDCTVDDVVYCFNAKANQLLRGSKRITNPVGLMIWSVPKAFEGNNALHLRHRQELEAARIREEQTILELQQQQAEWRCMLSDPRTPDDERKFLRQLLDEN